jgi:hypothetical protein
LGRCRWHRRATFFTGSSRQRTAQLYQRLKYRSVTFSVGHDQAFDPVFHGRAFEGIVVTLDRQGRLWGIEGGGLGFRWLGLFIAVRFVAHRPNVSIKPG